jgi:hypothetical protein
MADMAGTMERLRADALARGMQDLAVVYGWSLIQVRQHEIDRLTERLKRHAD